MRSYYATMFAAGILLVTSDGLRDGCPTMAAQQQAAICGDDIATPEGTQRDQASAGKRADAMIFADLKEEAVSLHRLVDEYSEKVKIRHLEPFGALELFAGEMEKKVLRVAGETEFRTAIERLIRWSDALKGGAQGAEDRQLSPWTDEQYFVACAALVPLWKQDLQRPERCERWFSKAFVLSASFPPHRLRIWRYSWEGIVLAGIDSYQDERAARFLLEYVLRASKADAVDRMAQWALVFLRAYDPALVKPAIEAAFKVENKNGADWQWSSSFLTHPPRAFLLHDCLVSLEVAESLPPQELAAYQYFQRRAWQTYALTPRERRPAFIHPAPTAPDSHYYYIDRNNYLNFRRFPSVKCRVSSGYLELGASRPFGLTSSNSTHASETPIFPSLRSPCFLRKFSYGYPPVPDWQDGNEQFILALLRRGVRQVPVVADNVSQQGLDVLFGEVCSHTLPMDAKERLAAMLPSGRWLNWVSDKYRERSEAQGDAVNNSPWKATNAEEVLARFARIQEKTLDIPTSNGFRSGWLMIQRSELLAEVEKAGREREVREELVRLRFTQGSGERSKDDMIVRCIDGLARLIFVKNDPELEKPAPEVRGYPGAKVDAKGRLCTMGITDRFERGDPDAVALLAIDSYADRRAHDFLMEFASRADLDDQTKAQVWQLLLHYDGARCLVSQFERAFRRSAEGGASRGFGYEIRLNSWVRELDYIESLGAAARGRYLQIRRFVFRADALAPRGARPPPVGDLSLLAHHWQDGDERFLPHLFESGRPFSVVIAEAPISAAGLAWLQEQADSGPWSDGVKAEIRRGLEEREKRQKPLERRNRHSSR